MSVEQDVYDRLAADATVAGLVGTRIYPVLLPQNVAMPAIVYSRVASVPHDDLELAQNHESARVQVDCWADSYPGAKALAAAASAALQLAPVYAQRLTDLDDYDPEEKLFRVILDFNIWS